MIEENLLAQGDYTLVRSALIKELSGDASSAVVLQRIHWRCVGPLSDDGWWTGTYEQLAREVGMSRDQVKRAVLKLRKLQALEAAQLNHGGAYDHTLSYRPAIGQIRPIG